MSTIDTTSKAASTGAAWSEAEKIAFFLKVYEQARETLNWDTLIPPGRTKEACTKMVKRMEAQAKKSGEQPEQEPKIKKGVAKPRAKKAAEGDASVADDDEPKTPKPKAARKPRGKKAKEENEPATKKVKLDPTDEV